MLFAKIHPQCLSLCFSHDGLLVNVCGVKEVSASAEAWKPSKSIITACCADVLLREETHPDCWRLIVRMQMPMRNLLSPVAMYLLRS